MTKSKNNKKIKFLKLQLSAAFVLLAVVLVSGVFVFTPISWQQVAQALTGNYSKSTGEQLTVSDWNNLPNDFLDKSGDTMSGDLNMGGNNINNVGSLNASLISGHSMSGDLNMNGSSITGVNSLTMNGSGDLNMNNRNITNLADPNNDNDAATKGYVDNNNGGYIFTNWGRGDCPSGTQILYSGYAFGKKWDEEYGSGEVLCIQSGSAGPPNSSSIRDKLWLVTTGVSDYTPPGIPTESAMKCAVCLKPTGVCYENLGSNTCAAGFSPIYSGYVMGGVTGIDNPNNRNNNNRHCVNSNYDGSTPVSNISNLSVYAGTIIVDNTDVPAYTTNAYIQCSICCN